MPRKVKTRSISFQPDILEETDKRAKSLRMQRSEYVNRILEQEFGLAGSLEGHGSTPEEPYIKTALPPRRRGDSFAESLRRQAAAQPPPSAAKAGKRLNRSA